MYLLAAIHIAKHVGAAGDFIIADDKRMAGRQSVRGGERLLQFAPFQIDHGADACLAQPPRQGKRMLAGFVAYIGDEQRRSVPAQINALLRHAQNETFDPEREAEAFYWPASNQLR